MKKSEKTSLVIGGLLLLGAGAWWLIKRTKKTYKELENREKQNHEILEQLGITEDENVSDEEAIVVDSEGTEVDIAINLPKQLNDLLCHDENYELDELDVNKFLLNNSPSEHTVHIRQRYDKGEKRNVLDLMFEIPLSALWSGKGAYKQRSSEDGFTCVGNFLKTIRGEWDREDNYLKEQFQAEIRYLIDNQVMLGTTIKRRNSKKTIIYSGLCGYLYLDYKEKVGGEYKDGSSLCEITKKMFEENVFNQDHSELTEFICDVRERLETAPATGLQFDMSDYIKNPENFKDVVINDAIAAIRITVPIQDRRHIDGITINTLKQIVDNIYNKLEIEGSGGGIFRYKHFVCYVPDTEQDGEIRVYGVNGDEISI